MPRRDPTARAAYNLQYRERNRASLVAKERARRVADPRRFRDAALRKCYGITLTMYETMLASQGGRCAICGSADPGRGPTRRNFAVDHDHHTGRVRGLLCNPCNRGLGLLRDSEANCRAAAAYLASHDLKTLKERTK